MLVNIHHDSPAEHRRLLVLGVVLLTLMATLVALSTAVFLKVFEDRTTLVLQAEAAGLQLPKNGDVRRHGVLVGRIASIDQDGKQAVITLALQPDAATTIDRGVRAEIIPTTLFGQKFVSLVDPDKPSGRMISDGDVVPSERVDTNVELNRILADLFPLLRSVDPADLNTTLHALATALQGRGAQIGELVDDLEGYVSRFNERLPTLREDLVLLAEVAQAYELATPDLVRLMRNATVTADTLVDERKQFETFLGDLTGVAGTTTRVLRENGDDMIQLGRLSRPMLRLLDTYSPQYPCLLQGLARYTSRLSEIFQNGRVNQVLEIGAVQRPAYDAGDRPEWGEVGHGPWCLGLPSPQVPIPPISLRNGTDQDEMNLPPSQFQRDGSFANPTSGHAGTPEEQRLVNALMSGQSGRPAQSYGSMGALLLGPQLRGTEVSAR